MSTKEGLGPAAVLKRFFQEEPHGRHLGLAEMRALISEERKELADLAAAEIGYTKKGDKYVPIG